MGCLGSKRKQNPKDYGYKLAAGVSWVVIVFVVLSLIVAYTVDLGGDVNIQQVDHNPCELEVDAASARRISHLIHHEEVKLFYLDLKFPSGVEVNKTYNIFQAYSLVWAFGGSPGTKHLLELPWMYLVWSFGILDHYTYRDVELTFGVKGNESCSLVLGTNRTSRAIVNALKEMTINISREDNQTDKYVMNSVWCQTYSIENITQSFEGYAHFFRFYFSNFRYICSHLDLDYVSNDYVVVTEDKIRPFTRRWSWLAFTFSILGLWFFPLPFSFSETTLQKKESISLGLSSPLTLTDVVLSPFRDCCESKCDCCTLDCMIWFKRVFLLIFLGVLFPFGIIISYITVALVPGSESTLSALDERDNALGRFSTCPGYIFSDTFPIPLYAGLSLVILPIVIECNEKGILFPSSKSNDRGEQATYKTHCSWFGFIPWFCVIWNICTMMPESKCLSVVSKCFKCNGSNSQCCNCCTCFCVLSVLVVLVMLSHLFLTFLILFKSLMFVCTYFCFGILSLVTFPKFTSGIFIYIFTVVLFSLKCIRYPGEQYHKFLALIIDVMKKDETLKGKCEINEKGDYGISKVLFFKLVDEHKPMTYMFFKLLFEFLFIVPLLIWTGFWIRDLNQWWEIATITDIVVSIIIFNFPKIFEILFFAEHNDVVKLRVKKSIRKYYTGLSFEGIEQACIAIKRAHAGIKQAYGTIEHTPFKIEQVRDGIVEAYAGMDNARDAIEDNIIAIEQSLHTVGEHSPVVAEQANRGREQDVDELEQCTFRSEKRQTRRLIEQVCRALHLVEIENVEARNRVEEACSELEQAGREIKNWQVCSKIKQTRDDIDKIIKQGPSNITNLSPDEIKALEKAGWGNEHGLDGIKQCRVRIDIEKARRAIREVRGTIQQLDEQMDKCLDGTRQDHEEGRKQQVGPIQAPEGQGHEGVRELLAGLTQACEGLMQALDGLEQTLNDLELAHDKQLPYVGTEEAHGEHSNNHREQALDGLNKANNELIKAIKGFKQVRYSIQKEIM